MNVQKALNLVETHVSKHSNNKYQNTVLNTETPLREPKFTLLTANKYMARYLANAGEKRAQIEDLAKAVHFILFEIQNRLDAQSEENPNQLKLDFNSNVDATKCSETNFCSDRDGLVGCTSQSGIKRCKGCNKKVAE